MEKQDFLVLTCECAYPGIHHAGGAIIWNTLLALSKNHRVSVAAFEKAQDQAQMREASRIFHAYRAVPANRGWISRLLRLPFLIFLPYEIVSVLSISFLRAVFALSRSLHPAVIQAEYFPMGIYLWASSPGSIKVLTLHDIQTDILEKTLTQVRGPTRGILRWHKWLTETWERRMCHKASLLLVLSEKDKQFLCDRWQIDQRRVHVFSPYVDFSLKSIPFGEGDGRTLLFVGAVYREVNREACEWFLEHVWPLIKAKRTEIIFRLVGGGDLPEDFIKKWGKVSGVEIAGYVADLSKEYRRATIVVVPLLRAGGIIVKVLEAFAAGRPVVATSVANSGIQADDGAIRLADSVEQFAAAVLDLMASENARRTLAANARNLVSSRYRWEDAIRGLENAYLRAMKRANR